MYDNSKNDNRIKDLKPTRAHYRYGEARIMSAFDIDLVEVSHGKPVALIDFKHPTRNYVNLNCGEVRFYNTMAKPHDALAFVNIYYFYNAVGNIMEDYEKQADECHRQHRIIALNNRTYNVFNNKKYRDLTEKDYVRFLYNIRKEKFPVNLKDRFCDTWREVPMTDIRGNYIL